MKIRIKKTPPQNGVTVEKNQYKTLSSDGVNLLGKSHEKGGTMVSSNGDVVEAEAGEPIYTNSAGENIVFGNVENPASGSLFKNEAKAILKDKGKNEKKIYQANQTLETADPYTRLGSLEYNSAVVALDGAKINEFQQKAQLDTLAAAQQVILNASEQMGVDPNKLSKKLKKGEGRVKVRIKGNKTAQDGGLLGNFLPNQNVPNPLQTAQQVGGLQNTVQSTIINPVVATLNNAPADTNYVQSSLTRAAQQVGVDPNILHNLVQAESSFRPGIAGPSTRYGTAYSHAQMLPATAKKYGITEAQLKSTRREDVDAVSLAAAQHFKDLQNQFGGDVKKALIAYNGGEGALKKIANFDGWNEVVGKPASEATGDDYIKYLAWRRENKPTSSDSAYQNQTFNYVNRITGAAGFENTPIPGYPQSQGFNPNNPVPLGEVTVRPGIQAPDMIGTPEITPRSQGDPVQAAVPAYNPITPRTIPQHTEASITSQQNQIQPINEPPTPNRLGFTDIVPEIAALFDRPGYVQGQQFNPYLQQQTRVSFQDQINQNTADFNALAKNFADNPAALATLAGQKYQQDQQILAEEFRANQSLANQVSNQNLQTLNQAEMTNLQLSDQQYVRQEQAKAITEQNRRNALNSISDKYAQNRLYNNQQQQLWERRNTAQSLHQRYTFDQAGNIQFIAPQDVESLLPGTPKVTAQTVAQAAFGHKFKKK